MTKLIPVVGSWIEKDNRIGRIIAVTEAENGPFLNVEFQPGERPFRVHVDDARCGIQIGHTVYDEPLSMVRVSLGSGTVRARRTLADCEQALVQWHADGQSAWVPWQQLRRIKDPVLAYCRGDAGEEDAAERVSLSIMAYALRTWNEATGALDRLDVDPLPHQISLVHRIIASGQLNWLIADDVGLGKTIEVGLLLAALDRRRRLRRILVVAPATLTLQWKQEMQVKFDRHFLIYGRDFVINDIGDWGRYEAVIISLDLAKPRSAQDDGSNSATPFGALMAAGPWDIVIFDEAHRLTRDEEGRTTLRFRLAERLRQMTDGLILLTGTPHQGDTGRFRNLLRLVRGDLAAAIDRLDDEPEVVREIVLRNRKIDVTDADGAFLFKGVTVKRFEIEATDTGRALEAQLKRYFEKGYGAADRIGGSQGRAVGFVMTIYRKLAASSVNAIYRAIGRRHLRLKSSTFAQKALENDVIEDEDDPMDGDDRLSERADTASVGAFFDDEIALLDDVLEACRNAVWNDPKRTALWQLIHDSLKDGLKLLIFTEYRDTQEYLLNIITRKFDIPVAIIHGGMDIVEKQKAIQSFDGDAPILISTEAGGEGLNLHRNCHILVNYDLPWNPTRISQRIGRIYRYGQKERVIVVNFHAKDTLDNRIIGGLIDRLDVISRQMSAVGGEYSERIQAEILGEMLERVDIRSLLEEARRGEVSRGQERIDAAIEQARKARGLQSEILNVLESFDPDAVKKLAGFTTGHVAAFVKRMAPKSDIVVETTRDPEIFTLRLPQDARGRFPEFGGRTVAKVTTRRRDWSADRETILIDFAGSFLPSLIKEATTPDFTPGAAGAEIKLALLAVFLARWQTDQGAPLGEELIVARRGATGEVDVNPSYVHELFAGEVKTVVVPELDRAARKDRVDALRDRAEALMAAEANRFRHPNDLVCLAILESSNQAAEV